MPRPHHHDRTPAEPKKESFRFSGLGITLIIFGVCLVCAPLYIALDAIGAFSFTGFVLSFLCIAEFVAVIAWLTKGRPRS